MTLALQKFPIGKFVAIGLMVWGTILLCTTAVQNFAGLMVLRFLLGGTESCIGPAWMILTGMFWTRREQPFRMTWWLGCDGIAVLLGAGISWGVGHSNSSIAPWRLIFVVSGPAWILTSDRRSFTHGSFLTYHR
jgi:MFS family permease